MAEGTKESEGEMSENQVIPNCVGRIDAITEAIREGKYNLVISLARKEHSRIDEKVESIQSGLEKATRDRIDVHNFIDEIKDKEKWYQARRECGWKPEDEWVKPLDGHVSDGPMKPEHAVPPKGERDSSKLDEQYERIVKHEAWLIGKEAAPKLDAAKLPVGAVMVLGGNEYKVVHYTRPEFIFFGRTGSNVWFRFDISEIQELIDRGVEFRVPKGGAH